jgi:hypothetical protein
MTDTTLTLQQAYLATFEYLSQLYKRYESDEVGTLLEEMSFLENGATADPAAWGDWLKCVEKARQGKVDARFILNPPQ